MRLIYRNGLFVPESAAEVQTRAINAETTFLQMLDAYAKEERFVSSKPSANYAPTCSLRTSSGCVVSRRPTSWTR